MSFNQLHQFRVSCKKMKWLDRSSANE